MKDPVVVGHQSQRDALQHDLVSGNVSHAYLFTGPRHVGKMAVARHFAGQLILQGIAENDQAAVSEAINRLIHPDLLVLDQLWMEDTCEDWNIIAKTSNVPQTHRAKKPAAKTDTISIDDIRALQERLHETATGVYRCCIIRSVERMQDAAANAFLKILEEPPPHLVFLLTTESVASLLPTITSRARILHFRPLARKEMQPLLAECEENDRRFILHIAQGCPGIACCLRDDPDLLRSHRLLHTQAASFWKAEKHAERSRLLKPLEERGGEADDYLLHLALTLREQLPGPPPESVAAFTSLLRGLETNAHRGLLMKQFALQIQK